MVKMKKKLTLMKYNFFSQMVLNRPNLAMSTLTRVLFKRIPMYFQTENLSEVLKLDSIIDSLDSNFHKTNNVSD